MNETFVLEDTKRFGNDIYKDVGRRVSFTSEDSTVKMQVIVYDYITPGTQTYPLTIDHIRRSVARKFPDINAETAVSNFRYTKNERGVYTTVFDVFVPGLQYTEEQSSTYHHYFYTVFIVTNGTLIDYKDLRYLMMKSVVTEGLQHSVWW